jgi:hypothetical protein
MKQTIIRFVGAKEELHKQIKKLCVETEISMNELTIGLLEKHLKKINKKQNEKLKTS